MKKFLNEDEPVLNEHLKVIHMIAWDMHRKYNYDLDDLFSEGCLQYLLKMEKFQDNRGAKFTTYIWTAIRNSLFDYIRFQTKLRFTDPLDDVVYEVEFLASTNYTKHPVKDVFQHCAF